MRRRLAALAACALLACTTPLEVGERRYSEGDRLAALEVWRAIPPDSLYYEAAQQRIGAVEDEFQQLVTRYKQRARYFERKDRLAESILSYRLAAKLQPDDRETLERVQALSRQLVARKAATNTEFEQAFRRGDLAGARRRVAELRALDPFDPELETDERQVEEALRSQVEGLLVRGRRGFSSGELGRAEAAFREVLVLEPENESAQGYLSYIASIRASESGRRNGPGPRLPNREPPEVFASDAQIRAEGFYQNALAAERAGDPYTAIRQDLRALAADPKHARARRHLAQVRAGQSAQLDVLIESGRTAFQQEDLQAALDHWRRALLIDPENERARQYVARAEKLLENLEQLRADGDGMGGGWR